MKRELTGAFFYVAPEDVRAGKGNLAGERIQALRSGEEPMR